jgi:hypothetical protein
MQRKYACGAGLVLLSVAKPALAAPICVAVADFDYVDSSGEVTDQRAAHAQRLRDMQADIIHLLTASGKVSAAALQCGKPPCSVDNLDEDQVKRAATAQHAQFVVFGGIHKISTLIQWGQIEVMDVATGKAVLSRTVTFRGDSDDAWRHAADYVGDLVEGSMKG